MYLTIASDDQGPHMGYVLCKNPQSPPFERDFGNSTSGKRLVHAEYLSEQHWRLQIINDEVFIQQQLKDENRPFYLSARAYAVNPANLKGVTVALGSAINGVNTTKGVVSDEQFHAVRALEFHIGPFTVEAAFVQEMFVGLGFAYENIGDADTPLAVAARLTIQSSITEALQRLVVGSYALTTGQNATKELNPDLVRALIKACKGWLNNSPVRDRVIARLVRWNKDLRKEFEKALAPEDKADEDEAPKESEEKESLHVRRHDVVLGEISKLVGPTGLVEAMNLGEAAGVTPMRPAYVLDLGAGDGKLTVRLVRDYKHARVVAIEGSEWSLAKLRRKTRGAYLRLDNIIAPYVEENLLAPDVMVLSEVIEHLTAPDRRLLISQISRLWRAKAVIITTPNRDYNAVFGMAEGELRHKDHKVEYDKEQLAREVINPLVADGYDVRVVPLLDETYQGRFPLVSSVDANLGLATGLIPPFGALVQPSFVVVAVRRPDAETHGPHAVHRARDLHAPLHIVTTGYTVDFQEMQTGLVHPVWMGHRHNLVWLAPTVPPVEYLPAQPTYLEHPEGAFKYFAERRVRRVVAQQKYMGSRATIVAFSSKEAAERMGYPEPIYVTSRQGYPFFNGSIAALVGDAKSPAYLGDGGVPGTTRDSLALAGLYHDLVRSRVFEGNDVVVLDCEALPWSFKAGVATERDNLLDRDFRRPIHAMIADARAKSDLQAAGAAAFALRALTYYDREEPLRFVPFSVLFLAKVDGEENKFVTQTLAEQWPVDRQMRWISDRLFDTKDGMGMAYFEPCLWHAVDLDDALSKRLSVASWEHYTGDGGEGYVYKPNDPELMPDAAPVQRALKVRGPEYLRLIYGPRYQEPQFFEKLVRRNVGKKRRLALQENELARFILQSFGRQQLRERDRYVAAFLGVDGVQGEGMDKTL